MLSTTILEFMKQTFWLEFPQKQILTLAGVGGSISEGRAANLRQMIKLALTEASWSLILWGKTLENVIKHIHWNHLNHRSWSIYLLTSVNDCVQSSSVGLQQPKGNLMLDQKLLFARLIHTQKQRAHTTVWVEDSHRSLHLQIYYTISNMKSIDLNSLSSPECWWDFGKPLLPESWTYANTTTTHNKYYS